MDLRGSLVDTNLQIYPREKLLNYLKTLPDEITTPTNILKIVKGKDVDINSKTQDNFKPPTVQLNNKDIENLKTIINAVSKPENTTAESSDFESKGGSEDFPEDESKTTSNANLTKTPKEDEDFIPKDENPSEKSEEKAKHQDMSESNEPYLLTSDIDWLHAHLQERRKNGEKDIPYLHELLDGASIEMPENKVIKRNPVLEARCVKLRAQQEAREYRKMTKTVDNVRMRFPEDSINYQLKHINRQLIAIGQFVISIFAGFLFGFRGVEWMVGNLDFGFRLLLGVMCALIIALAEIYFLAKKLNEELNIMETVQLGGPPKFADETKNGYVATNVSKDKEHKD